MSRGACEQRAVAIPQTAAVMTEAEFQLKEDRRVMGILDILHPMDDYFT